MSTEKIYKDFETKILSFSQVFPSLQLPNFGLFVRERLHHVTSFCDLVVINPISLFKLLRISQKTTSFCYFESQDSLPVYHNRFFYMPRIGKSLDGFFLFLSSFSIVSKIRQNFNFDLIDAHFAYPTGLAAVLLGKCFNVPVTITLRGTLPKHSEYFFRRKLILYALRNATRIMSVSQSLKDCAVSLGINPHKIYVVPNGVDIEKFSPIDKQVARKEFDLPLDRKIIISVGGLTERKGFHRIIEVMPKIKKVIPEIMLVVVGGPSPEGNFEPFLRRQISELGLEHDVLLTGQVPHSEVHKWLSAADIFCLATSNEGWANVFFEAMACGLPVVTTKVGGNPEVICSEDYGFLVEFGDREALAEAIINAFKKNWDRQGIINYARENTWDKVGEKVYRNFVETIQTDSKK